MKQLSAIVWIVLAAGLPACAQQQPATQQQATPPTSSPRGAAGTGLASEPRVFRVHVVDGRTGESIAGARVQLWYDEPSGSGYTVASGAHGEAPMPKPVGEPVRVLVAVSGYTDCRRPVRGAAPEGYNLATIAQSGIAAQNTCGGSAVHPAPGELIVSVRPARWYENINRTPSE